MRFLLEVVYRGNAITALVVSISKAGFALRAQSAGGAASSVFFRRRPGNATIISNASASNTTISAVLMVAPAVDC